LDTNLFSGKMLISVRGTPTTAAAAAPGGPLACKHRTFHIAVQGRFKRSFRAADLVSGQEFPKPPRSASLMHFVFSGAARVFASTIDVFVHGMRARAGGQAGGRAGGRAGAAERRGKVVEQLLWHTRTETSHS
jgi:hypothetical protein